MLSSVPVGISVNSELAYRYTTEPSDNFLSVGSPASNVAVTQWPGAGVSLDF